MKNNFSRIQLAKLCGWFGITRQAYYQNSWKAIEVSIEEDLVLNEVKKYVNAMDVWEPGNYMKNWNHLCWNTR
jgi:hypothetical protein